MDVENTVVKKNVGYNSMFIFFLIHLPSIHTNALQLCSCICKNLYCLLFFAKSQNIKCMFVTKFVILNSVSMNLQVPNLLVNH